MKKLFGLSLAAALMLTAYNATAAEELSMQTNYQQSHVQMVKNLLPDAEKIAKATNGELKINVYSIGAIVPANEVIIALKDGMIDMGCSFATADLPSQHPVSGILAGMPGLASSAHQATALYWKMYETVPEFKAELDSIGKVLAIWAGPINAVSSVNKPIKSPADIKGMKVLFCVPSSKAHIEAWGGIPVQVSSSEIYTGLQRGMGEAFIAPLPMQRGAGLADVAKYVTLIPTNSTLQGLAINPDVFDSLSAEHQKLLLDTYASRDYSFKLADTLDEDIENGAKIFEAAGCQVIRLNDAESKVFTDALLTQSRLDNHWLPALKKSSLKGDHMQWIERVRKIADEVRANGK